MARAVPSGELGPLVPGDPKATTYTIDPAEDSRQEPNTRDRSSVRARRSSPRAGPADGLGGRKRED